MTTPEPNWPSRRDPAELREDIKRRGRQRQARRLSGSLVAVLLVAGGLAVWSHAEPTSNVVASGPEPSSTSTSTTVSTSGEQGVTAGSQPEPSAAPTPSTTTSTAAPVNRVAGPGDVGVTADAVVLGNVSTLTTAGVAGVAGEDLAAAGARAAVAYQNSLGGIWGRRVTLDVRDDKGLASTNRDQTRALTGSAFALLGSSSLVDDAGADALRSTNVPDVTRPLTLARQSLANNVSVAPSPPSTAFTTLFDWVKATNPGAASSVATLHLDDPKLRDIHVAHLSAAKAAGWNISYDRQVSVTETDYTGDVVRMRQNGARTVYLVGMRPQDTQRLANAMRQQNFRPDLFIAEGPATILDPASDAADGIISSSATVLLDGQDDTRTAEARTFRDWFNRIAPGRQPEEHAAMAWASGRLLFQAMTAAGPDASRDQVLRALNRIDHFDANGLIADAGPGTKRPSSCLLITQIRNQHPTRLEPASGFRCAGREIRS